MNLTPAQINNILTRTSGFLKTVSSHSLQPYRGCSFGRSLCGVGCYVQHNRFLNREQQWGTFLEPRINAAGSYHSHYNRERAWARAKGDDFSVFMSSSTDPFVPQENRFHITRQLLEAMLERPPDELILQTHSHRVTMYEHLYEQLARRCRLRFHLSVESDVNRLPGLPPPASSVENRLQAAHQLKQAGLTVVITVAPLLPIADPEGFFQRVAEVANAVVIDHFIGGDGSNNGTRTLKTGLPQAMAATTARSTTLSYRDEIVHIARQVMPGKVGVNIDGFAARYLPRSH